jgi:uncharacterized membrane protein
VPLAVWDRIRLGASLIGVGIAGYLTAQHYSTGLPLACSSSGIVNCERVLTSPEGVWFGVPVALWGLAWFAVAGALAVLSLRFRDTAEPAWLRWSGIGWTLAGVAVVLRLLYLELIVIARVCLWCTAVHVLVIGIFVTQILTDAARLPAD